MKPNQLVVLIYGAFGLLLGACGLETAVDIEDRNGIGHGAEALVGTPTLARTDGLGLIYKLLTPGQTVPWGCATGQWCVNYSATYIGGLSGSDQYILGARHCIYGDFYSPFTYDCGQGSTCTYCGLPELAYVISQKDMSHYKKTGACTQYLDFVGAGPAVRDYRGLGAAGDSDFALFKADSSTLYGVHTVHRIAGASSGTSGWTTGTKKWETYEFPSLEGPARKEFAFSTADMTWGMYEAGGVNWGYTLSTPEIVQAGDSGGALLNASDGSLVGVINAADGMGSSGAADVTNMDTCCWLAGYLRYL
jgi:hypothetical protein